MRLLVGLTPQTRLQMSANVALCLHTNGLCIHIRHDNYMTDNMSVLCLYYSFLNRVDSFYQNPK